LNTHYRADYNNDIKNVALARRGVSGFAAACGFSESEIADIRLAAGEALSNAVEHGCDGPSVGFTVECNFDGDELLIEIRDSGHGFPAPEGQGAVVPDHRGRGFGIFLMRRLMDDVVFARNGTVVRLVRRHPGRRHPAAVNGAR
jgi:serine/threonine-protein kinase RsbW